MSTDLSAVDLTQALVKLKDAGLTFADVVAVYTDGQSDEHKQFVADAREQHEVEGQVEIDDKSIVSEGRDNGAYVMAWVWVSRPDPMDDQDDELDEAEDADDQGA